MIRALFAIGSCAITSAAAMALYGCGREQAQAQAASVETAYLGPHVWIDPKTGCEYLIQYSHGISARFHQNGLPICHGVER